MRRRIGLSVMLLESRREAILGLATEGDRLGYDGFFMPEAWAYDMTVLLAEAAARTTRIMLGTGILGIWNRSAATIAMAAATLHAISGGRFVLGLGASTPQLAEGLHDTPFEPPVPRMRRRGRRGSSRSLRRRARSTAIRSCDRATARPWRRCSRPTRRSSRAPSQPTQKTYSINWSSMALRPRRGGDLGAGTRPVPTSQC